MVPDKPGFLEELKRRHVWRVAVAYAVVGWLLVQIVTQVFPFFHVPDWVVRAVIVVIVIGFPVAVIFEWIYELTPEGIRRTAPEDSPEARATPQHRQIGRKLNAIIVAALVLAVALLGWRLFAVRHATTSAASAPVASAANAASAATTGSKSQAPTVGASAAASVASTIAAQPIPPKSVAVLPFVNLSTEKSNAYFADGIQDLILTKLADIGDLKVIARTSTMSYGSHPENLTLVGKQLGVATILEGSVQKAGKQVLINVQLIDAGSDAHIWAQSYTRTLDNIFGVEGEVAGKVAEALKAKLTPVESARVANVPTTDAAALNADLLGQYYGNLAIDSNVRKDFDKAIGQYSLAVKYDPKFALAWAHLAFMQLTEASFYGDSGQPGLVAQAKANFERALAIQPDLAFALIDKAWYVYVEDHDFAEAQEVLAKAHALKPQAPGPLFFSALFHVYAGQWDAALEPARKAAALDPRNKYTVGFLGEIYSAMRRYHEALPLAERDVAIAPESVSAVTDLVQLHCVMGNIHAAKDALDAAPPDMRSNADYQRALGNQLLLDHDYAAARALHAAMRPTDDLPQWNIDLFGGDIEWQAGQRDDARAFYQHAVPLLEAAIAKSAKVGYLHLNLAWAYARLGQAAAATHEVTLGLGQHAFDARNAQLNQLRAAKVWVQIGRASEAITGLEHLLATPTGMSISVSLLKLDPVWDPIRHDPAFQTLLKKYVGPQATPATASTSAATAPQAN